MTVSREDRVPTGLPSFAPTPIRSSSLDRFARLLAEQPSIHLALSIRHGCKTVVELLGCMSAVVALKHGDTIFIVSGWTEEGDVGIERPWTVPLDHSLAYQAMLRNEPIEWETHPYTADSADDRDLLDRLYTVSAASRCFACPIRTSAAGPIGALVVSTKKSDPIPDDDVMVASIVAASLSTAFEANRDWAEAMGRRAAIAHEMVAQQVHDTLAQDVAALGLLLEAAEGRCADPEAARRDIAAARELCLRVDAGTRALMAGQRKGYGGSEDLVKRLKYEIDQSAAEGRVRFTLSVANDVDVEAVSEEVRDQVVVSVHEALLNAFKHASPTLGLVRLRRDGANLVLIVQNDGAEPNRKPSGTRFGLKNLAEMARRLGGTLEASHDEEEGTFTVRESIPMGGRGVEVGNCGAR